MLRRNDDPRVLVLLDCRPVLTHQRFDLYLVESAACENDDRSWTCGAVVARRYCEHYTINVAFDVDSGLILELLLAVFLHGHEAADFLSEVGRHDFVNIRICDQRGIVWHELELVGTTSSLQRARREAHVIGQQPGAQPRGQDEERSDHEIASFCGHERSLGINT